MIKKIWDIATQRFQDQSKKQYDKGMKKYNVPLTNFNGRNPFQDAREEVVDMHQYLTQAEEEFKTIANLLYVYAINEGFFGTLPKHVQQRLMMVVDGKFIADICKEEGIEFYGTIAPYGPKAL